MKIQAAVLEQSGAVAPFAKSMPLVVQEVELDGPGAGEVLVKIEAAGLCHSDLSVVDGNRQRPTPMVLGHEAAGTVVELGRGVTDLSKGDRVIFVFVPSCGHCSPCSEGRPALCEPAMKHNGAGTLLCGERRLSRGGQPLHHHLGVSAFAQFATVSRRSLVKVDRDLPAEIAALFGCAVLTGAGAVINTAQVKAGTTVAIVGLGGVGMAAVLAAIASGAERIVVIDRLQSKVDFAKTLGATDSVLADAPDAIAMIKELTRGGVDVAIELAGSAKAMELAYAITRRGGTTVSGGLPHPSAVISIPAVTLVAEERTIKGSYIGTSVPVRDLPRLIALYRRGRLPVDKLLTHRLELAQLNVALDRLHDGTAIRQVLTF